MVAATVLMAALGSSFSTDNVRASCPSQPLEKPVGNLRYFPDGCLVKIWSGERETEFFIVESKDDGHSSRSPKSGRPGLKLPKRDAFLAVEGLTCSMDLRGSSLLTFPLWRYESPKTDLNVWTWGSRLRVIDFVCRHYVESTSTTSTSGWWCHSGSTHNSIRDGWSAA